MRKRDRGERGGYLTKYFGEESALSGNLGKYSFLTDFFEKKSPFPILSAPLVDQLKVQRGRKHKRGKKVSFSPLIYTGKKRKVGRDGAGKVVGPTDDPPVNQSIVLACRDFPQKKEEEERIIRQRKKFPRHFFFA